METQKNNGMCRCCASEGTFKDVKSSYQWMGEEEVYADMLRECLDISLCADVTGEVEGGICEVCITQLRNASNFKKQVLHTEEQFKQRLEDKFFKNEIVKVEMAPEGDEDSDNDNNDSAGDDPDYSGTEFEVPVKMECEESKPKKRGKALKASTSRAKKLKKEAGETSKRIRSEVGELASEKKIKIEEVDVKCEIKDEIDEKVPPADKMKVRKKPNGNAELQSWRAAVRDLLVSSNATAIRFHNDKGFGCCFCREQFLDPAELKTHSIAEHATDIAKFKGTKEQSTFVVKMDITDLKCTSCEQKCDTIEQIITHLNEIHGKDILPDIKKVILPFKFAHSNELKCCECSQAFHTFSILQNHMHSHYSNYICDVCSASFVTKKAFTIHSTTHETGSFKCSYCSKVFDSRIKARNHELATHKNPDNRLVCRFCNEGFPRYAAKHKHLQEAHGVVPTSVKCPTCDKSFTRRSLLLSHTRRQHLMMRPHKCTQCSKECYTTSELSQHLATHSSERKYCCEVCPKTFRHSQALNRHKKKHSDSDVRFKCEHCGHMFASKDNLKRHKCKKHSDLM